MEHCDKGLLTSQIHEIKWTGPIHCRGDMVVRMCKVLAIPWSWYVCLQCMIWTFLLCWLQLTLNQRNTFGRSPRQQSMQISQRWLQKFSSNSLLSICKRNLLFLLCPSIHSGHYLWWKIKNTWTCNSLVNTQKMKQLTTAIKKTIITATTTTTEQKRLKYRC